MECNEGAPVSEVDVLLNILRATDSATNHESAVNRCHVAADEIERLYRLVGELLPFMMADSQDGVRVGARSDSDTCEPDCADCVWYEKSVVWQERINAGEFVDWSVGADGQEFAEQAHGQSATVAESAGEADDQMFIDTVAADVLSDVHLLQARLAKLERKCARLSNALNWYMRKNPATAEDLKKAISGNLS